MGDWLLYVALIVGLAFVSWISYSVGKADGWQNHADDEAYRRSQERRTPRDAQGRWLYGQPPRLPVPPARTERKP